MDRVSQGFAVECVSGFTTTLNPPPAHPARIPPCILPALLSAGTDHAASLEPAGLGKMCRDLVATHEALTLKPSDILKIETEQRNKLKYRKQ